MLISKVFKDKIKFDDWKVMKNLISDKGYMFQFDIKQGYHHIDIFEEHQTYLGFSWKINDKLRYFIFTVLPFGLTSAPFIFTKIMRSLVKFWREQAIAIAVYLDDGLGAANSYSICIKHSFIVNSTLINCGFIVNVEKSNWKPSKILTWIGITANLENKTYTIPSKRVISLAASISKIKENLPYSTARNIAKLCGKIISTKFILGDIVQLKTRNLYKVIKTATSWDSRINFKHNDVAIKELIFWQQNFVNYNTRQMIPYRIPEIEVFSDASNHGIGSHFLKNNRNFICYKNLNQSEIDYSSTWREIFAILYSLECFIPMFKKSVFILENRQFSSNIYS